MALSLVKRMAEDLSRLRYQPTPKRIRLELEGAPVADTTAAVLVWEPMRIVPSYAVPEKDVTATLQPASAEHGAAGVGEERSLVLTPRDPFSVHTANGEVLTVVTPTGRREGAAFRLADPDLAGYVVLEFAAFSWREEDDAIVGHPRDPFHRIDVRRSGRSVRIEHERHVLAESTRTRMLFEGAFPFVRYYIPPKDVIIDLAPGTLSTTCAYKGHATHYSATVDGAALTNIAWSYQDPLEDATAVRGLISFYQERLDLFVEGRRIERESTPWS
jgi:uncharacterized protein (DUF427 family)